MRSGPESDARGVRVSADLIGRDDLVALAQRRWLGAVAGRGHLLLLAGEAGIGKTRLLRELATWVGRAGGAVVTGEAAPSDAGTAGGALLDLAGQLARSPDPVLAGAGVALGRRLRVAGGGRDGDAHHRRRVLVADLTEILQAVGSAAGPVLLAMEDLHSADELTLEVLDRGAGALRAAPVLLVATYRTDEVGGALRPWRTRLLHQRRAEEARLSRLDSEQTARLCQAIAGDPVAAARLDLVWARSDGIPLHVEELLATDDQGVPETMAAAVLARAAGVSAPARVLADAVSVLGRGADVGLLAAVGGLSDDEVDRAVRELTGHFILATGPDRDTVDVRHALLRDALYADLAPNRRRELHARAAVAAAAAGLGDAMVSDQYERAGQAGPAFEHALRAARAAAAVSAHREAVELYRRAQRTVPSATSGVRRADLLTELATELATVDDNRPAARAYAQAHAIRSELGDERGAAALVAPMVAVGHLLGDDLATRTAALTAALDRLGPADGDVRAALLAALAAAHMLARHLDAAISYGERARAEAAASDAVRLDVDNTLGAVLVFAGRGEEGWALLTDAVARGVAARSEAQAARGYRMLGTSASVLVEYERASAGLTEGIAYAERTERWNDRHYLSAHLSHVDWARGDWAAADRRARQALVDGAGAITTRITALHVLGYLALGRGDADGAVAWLEEARTLAEPMGELQRLSPAWWGLAEVDLHSGRPDGAIAWCERGFAASDEVADAAYLFPYVVTGVRAHLDRSDLSGARDWLRRVAGPLRRRQIPGTLPALTHAGGLLLLADGHTGQARAALAEAAREWALHQRFWEGTQALLDQARAALRSRRPDEAAELTGRARAAAAAVGAVPLLTRADELTGPARTPGPLTTRELEIAHLIATGATNREIAAQLRIAPKTVAAHVEHILTKLGAARRAEVAAWVTRTAT